MKKTILFPFFILTIALLSGCDFLDDSSDDKEKYKAEIEERIQNLEDALNDNDYEAFKTNFDPSCSLEFGVSYTETDFQNLTDNGDTDFSFSDITVDDLSATCKDTQTTLGIQGTPLDVEFTFKEDNGDVLIFTWDEDGNEIFFKKKK